MRSDKLISLYPPIRNYRKNIQNFIQEMNNDPYLNRDSRTIYWWILKRKDGYYKLIYTLGYRNSSEVKNMGTKNLSEAISMLVEPAKILQGFNAKWGSMYGTLVILYPKEGGNI